MKIEEAKAVISTYDFSEDNEDNEFKEALKVAIRSLEAWDKVIEEIKTYCGQWSEYVGVAENCNANRDLALSIINNALEEVEQNREEAIEILKAYRNKLSNSVSNQLDGDIKAFDMAIESLEQEQKYCDRNICIKNEYNGIGCDECEVTKSQEPCGDAISRQAVKEQMIKCGFHAPDMTVTEFVEDLPSVSTEKTGHCKDCKYFEYDSVAKADGIPLIVAHEICSKWGNGCKTREDGYCFLFEPQESEE